MFRHCTCLIALAAALAAGQFAFALTIVPAVDDAAAHVYRTNHGQYLWLERGLPNAQAREALEIIGEAQSHGLRSADYWLDELSVLDESLTRGTSDFTVEYEGLMTDALLRLFKDLRPLLSRNPVTVPSSETSFADALLDAVHSRDLRGFYTSLLPRHNQYSALQAALQDLEARESVQAVTIGRGPTLRPGDSGERVAALRARLVAEPSTNDAVATFDAELEAAVRNYQLLHGLDADGVVGRRTQEHLDVPDGARRAQLRLALARWRELPADLGSDYVHVNIPEYRLQMYRDGEPHLSMRVVVGSKDDPTPVFNDEIEYLVFNPYWHVPRSIALEELIPLAVESPGYLERNDYEITRNDQAVSEASIDWQAMNAATFDYRIRQKPGSRNALGAVKFLFPNELNIYLHDSPARSLYARPVRAFSHGCIRVEDPAALAQALLERQGEWDEARVRTAIANGTRRQINLRTPVAVYLTYITAKVTESGAVAFLDDVYGRDSRAIRRYL